jgi:hypothetical protein
MDGCGGGVDGIYITASGEGSSTNGGPQRSFVRVHKPKKHEHVGDQHENPENDDARAVQESARLRQALVLQLPLLDTRDLFFSHVLLPRLLVVGLLLRWRCGHWGYALIIRVTRARKTPK